MTASVLGFAETFLMSQVRQAVREVEPTAQVLLFGSRARGDATPDSDWDLLVLLEGAVDYRREAAIQHRLYDLELEADAILSTIVLSRAEWGSPLFRATPFHRSVVRDAVEL